METGGARRVLEVYVAPDCWGCDTALRLVAVVRDLRLPGLEVRVVDLTAPGAVRPPSVFAVPTYLIDGRTISLGNPEETDLIDRLQSLLPINQPPAIVVRDR